jgi:hypothetical protein
MPTELAELARSLGFSTPLIYAAATYSFFHWLDKKASGPAKKMLSEWIRSVNYEKQRVGLAILEAFDRIYGYPPFSLRTLGRVAVISIGFQAALLTEFIPEVFPLMRSVSTWKVMIPVLMASILVDFLSVVLVRKCLSTLRERPLLSLFIGLGTGFLVMWIVAGVQSVVFPMFSAFDYKLPSNLTCPQNAVEACIREINALILKRTEELGIPTLISSLWITYVPAFAIHLWLPLFAVSLAGARSINYFAGATKWMQWFIKSGRDHPFDAIGILAASIVFVSVGTIRWII